MKRFFVAFIIFLLIDFVWLSKVAPNFYKSHIGHLMSQKVNFTAAIIFYVIYIIALLIFVINPSVQNNNTVSALYLGALIGLAMYGTYDLTNMATLKEWPLIVTVVDLMWGTFITSVTCFLSTYVIRYLKW